MNDLVSKLRYFSFGPGETVMTITDRCLHLLSDAANEIEKLRETFAHPYVQGDTGNYCDQCGLHFEDPIHGDTP